MAALPAAAGWIEALLLGTVGTVLAIVAVAFVGLMMLWGRVQLRRGASVIIGCFILFGARVIVEGILGSASLVQQPLQDQVATPTVITADPTIAIPKSPPAVNYDPYAGAAVPQ